MELISWIVLAAVTLPVFLPLARMALLRDGRHVLKQIAVPRRQRDEESAAGRDATAKWEGIRREKREMRNMALVFAGLIFAGLSLTTGPESIPWTAELLAVALCTAISVWLVTNLPIWNWSFYVADPLILASVGSLLLAAFGLLERQIGTSPVLVASFGLVIAAEFAFSIWRGLQIKRDLSKKLEQSNRLEA